MSEFPGFHVAPGAVIQRSSDDPDIRASNQCRDVGAVHFCTAERMTLGYQGVSDNNPTGVGILFMTRRGGEVGLSIALTPKAMRSLCTSLDRMASEIEANAAREATAVIDRAKAAGK